MGMNVLVVGNGAREHVMVAQCEKSDKVATIHVAPANGLMNYKREKEVVPYPEVKASETDKLVELARTLKPDLVVIGPEAPLAVGLGNRLQEIGIPTFGSTQEAAMIETDKWWARDLMKKYGISQPNYRGFDNEEEARRYVGSLPSDWRGYVKAAGLCEGKGALKANNAEEALRNIGLMKTFGESGRRFLVEDFISGDDGVNEEFSGYAFLDGKIYKMLKKFGQDNKLELNFDKGDQTGGMAAHAHAMVVTKEIAGEVDSIFAKASYGMQQEGRPYKGVLYLGGMVVRRNGVYVPVVCEFNARFGDPEAQVINTGIKTDFIDIAFAVIEGKLDQIEIVEDDKTRVCIVGASHGYPRKKDYSAVQGKQIFGLQEAMKVPGVTVYGAGIKRDGDRFYADGGRLFSIVAEGRDIIEARALALYAMGMVYIEGNNLHYRTDVGWRDVERLLRGENVFF